MALSTCADGTHPAPALYHWVVPMSLTRPTQNPYIAFAAIAFGLFTFVADHGIIIIALPTIADHFGKDLPTTQWVLIGYVLAISGSLLPMGRLGDLVGRKAVYVVGFVVFVVSGVLAGLAPTMPALIGASVLHGVGAGMTQGTSLAMIVGTFPESERGKALGLYMGVVGVGSVFGPAVGGAVIGAFGWSWAFFGIALLGLAAAIGTMVLVDSDRPTGPRGDGFNFDWIGAVLSTAALLAFLQGMTWAPAVGYGSPLIGLAFAAAVLLTVAFIVWELRTSSPLLELRLFRNRVFRTGVISAFVHFMGTTSGWFMMPFYLQVVLGYSAGRVGAITALSYVAMAVTGPVSGRLSDQVGRRVFLVGGLAVTTLGVLTLSTLRTDSHVGVAIAGMIMQSVGIAAFNPPNNGAVLGSVGSANHAMVSGFLNLVRNSASVTSVAIATAIVTATMGSMGYPPTLAAVSAEGTAGLLAAFVAGLRYVYLAMACVLVLNIAFTAAGGVPVWQKFAVGRCVSGRRARRRL